MQLGKRQYYEQRKIARDGNYETSNNYSPSGNLESYFVYDKFGLKSMCYESLKSASVTDNHMIQDLIDKLTRRKTNQFINEELVYKYYEQSF